MRMAGLPVVALALVAVLGSCQPGREPRRANEARGTVAARTGSSGVARSEPSLFELGFALVDDHGRTRHLAEFRGQPVVMSMVYTSCESVCPRITADLHALERALPEDVRARTRFVLFSLDPRRDTPAALAEFARRHALDPARWTMLGSSEDDMRTLAAVLGVRFRPDAEGEIAHSAVIAVADSRGVLRHRQMGLAGDPALLVAALRAAD